MELDIQQKYSGIYQNYERYAIIPIVLFLFSIAVLGGNYVLNGHFVQMGTDFTGGSEIQYTVEGEVTPAEVEQAFADAGREDANALLEEGQERTYILVRAPPPTIDDEDQAIQILADAGIDAQVESLRSISAAVSDEFFLQAQVAFLIGFTIMSLVILIAFKDLTPSVAVIAAAVGDIMFALAGMAILGIPLTLGSLAALLMLIGYSVDTDIVLSTRTLKQKRGSLEDRMLSSVKTGLTMSSGGIAGFALLYFVSVGMVGPSELSNIAAVMVIGLIADMPFTWFGNAALIKKYKEGDLKYVRKVNEVMPWS